MFLGIVPYLSSRALLIEHAPLKQFLEQRLSLTIHLASAQDPHRFTGRLMRGDFDFALVPPHLARLVQKEHGFLPLQAIKTDFYALLLVNKAEPVNVVADLKGREVHFPHHLSLVSLQVERYLQAQGLVPRQQLKLRYYNTDNNAVLALAGAREGAAATSRTVFERMPQDIRSSMRILGSTASVTSLVFVAHPRMPAARLAALRAALDEFPYSEAGMNFLQGRGMNLVPIEAADLSSWDYLLPDLRNDVREFLP